MRPVIAFGSSMAPLIPSGAELLLERVHPNDIRRGDIILYRQGPDVSVTHRVVQVVRSGAAVSFLTKGDNRSKPDPVVLPDQVLGRVARVGGRNIRRVHRRAIGRLVAWVSLSQYRVSRSLAECALNRLRHRLETTGVLPRVNARYWLGHLLNPLLWLNGSSGLVADRRMRSLKQRLRRMGIRVEYAPGPDTRFLVQGKDRLLGSAAVSLLNRPPASPEGVIEAVELDEEGWGSGAGRLLFHEMVRWFRKNKVKRIELKLHPISGSPQGIPVNPFLAAAAEFDFVPTEVSRFVSATRTENN